MAGKRDALKRSSTTPSGINDLMQRMAAGVTEETAIAESRGWRYTATGLDIQRDLTLDEFRKGLLPEIEAAQSAYQLIVGDACLYGLEHGFIESYEDMAELTGYTAGTIEMYTSLCRSIPRLVRTNLLTYSHYQQIAPLPEDERPHWISYAASNGLSYRALKALIADTELPAAGNNPDLILEDPPALSDEDEEEATPLFDDFDLTDPVHEKRFIGFRKRAAQNRYAEIDLIEIQEAEKWLAVLRKKVAQAKVEADKQARMKTK